MADRMEMKLVPDREPDVDGVWVEILDDVRLGWTFTEHEAAVAHIVPRGYHVVAFRRVVEK